MYNSYKNNSKGNLFAACLMLTADIRIFSVRSLGDMISGIHGDITKMGMSMSKDHAGYSTDPVKRSLTGFLLKQIHMVLI